MFKNSCFLRNVLERFVVVIAEQDIAFAFHFVGHLENNRSVAFSMRIWSRKVMKVCMHVVGNKRIEVAIVVIVVPGSPRAEAAQIERAPMALNKSPYLRTEYKVQLPGR